MEPLDDGRIGLEERPRRISLTPERPMVADNLVSLLGIVARALGDRALVWIVTLGALGVTAETVLHPEPWRIAAAVVYALTVLMPVLYVDQRGGR